MDRFSFDLKGFEQSSKTLRSLSPVIERRVLQKSLNAGARVGRQAIKQAAPRNSGDQSPASKQYGTLRKNIRIKRLKRVKPGMRAARVDTGRAFWATFIEFGTRHIAPKPFFASTFRKVRAAVLKAISEEMKKQIPIEAAREAKRNGIK